MIAIIDRLIRPFKSDTDTVPCAVTAWSVCSTCPLLRDPLGRCWLTAQFQYERLAIVVSRVQVGTLRDQNVNHFLQACDIRMQVE
jgi:hypothetical protein